MTRHRWLAPWAVAVGLLAGGNWMAYRAINAETTARQRQSCDIAVGVGVESAEAIIEVASADGTPPEPEQVAAYRRAIRRRMEAVAEDLGCE